MESQYKEKRSPLSNQRFKVEEMDSQGSRGSERFVMLGYFTCPICLSGYTTPDIFSWGDCHHEFCIHCIQGHILAQIGRLALPSCPEHSCSERLNQEGELYRALPSALKLKIQKVISYKNIRSNPNFKPCQDSDCTGSFDSSKTLLCPLCKSRHCKNCFSLSHEGECESRVALHLEMTKKYRQCGRCGQVIEKTEGCTHMTCPCGNYFCYSCGQPLMGDHQCQAPEDLNCMQSIRWQIQHLQFWYETASWTLLKILLFFSPPTSLSRMPKALWIIGFSLSFYPLVVALGMLLALATIVILLTLGLILTLVVPFTELCGGSLMLFPNSHLAEHCGCCIALLVVILFYPLIYLLNLVQLLYEVIQKQGVNILIPVIQIFNGLKLIMLFPCLMTVDNQQFYLSTAYTREPHPQMLMNLSDELQ